MSYKTQNIKPEMNSLNSKPDHQSVFQFVENQDLLLSCTLPLDQSDSDEFSMDNPFQFINTNSFISENQDIKEEIIDFNIFELLQAEDPEMARLLESVGNNDSIGYLPQISINSTKKILEKINETDSFNELSDLLSLNQTEDLSNETLMLKSTPPSPPLTPPTGSSRVSMRLIKKRTNVKNETTVEKEVDKKKARGCSKRKRSIDEDDEDMSRNLMASNENSVDLDNMNDTFYNDEDSNSMNSFEDSKQGFDDYLRKLGSRSKRLDSKELDPMKKESNKEAANRYRIKKLNEKDKLFETKQGLEKDNDQIKKRIELVQTEINYLKNLLVQMLLTKGVLNNSGNGIL